MGEHVEAPIERNMVSPSPLVVSFLRLRDGDPALSRRRTEHSVLLVGIVSNTRGMRGRLGGDIDVGDVTGKPTRWLGGVCFPRDSGGVLGRRGEATLFGENGGINGECVEVTV